MRRQTPDFSAVRGKHILIALSGGVDSVALCDMLRSRREADALTLSAAHLDHGIRPDSALDAEWCRELCARWEIPFHTVRLDVPAEARRTGEGLETAARRLRYAWLRKIADETGAEVIALAHHLDDQAETVLMHLLRGAGPEGASAMPALRNGLYRPLLGLRKSELREYLIARGLSWREDSTNAVDDNPRNALRLNAIPALEACYPEASRALARYAATAAIESDYVAGQAEAYMGRALSDGPYGRHLRVEDDLSPAILRRCVRSLCPGLSHERIDAAAALMDVPHGRAELNGDTVAERGRLGIYFLPKDPPAMPEAPLNVPGSTRLPGLCEIIARLGPAHILRDDPFRQALDADALQGAVVRTRRDGDLIRPLNCGEKLLSDYLTDRHIDRPLRGCLPLIARGQDVFWVCGVGISQLAALRPNTRQALILECRLDFDMDFSR